MSFQRPSMVDVYKTIIHPSAEVKTSFCVLEIWALHITTVKTSPKTNHDHIYFGPAHVLAEHLMFGIYRVYEHILRRCVPTAAFLKKTVTWPAYCSYNTKDKEALYHEYEFY